MTANAKYKEYKNQGGEMTFKDWLNWSKQRGFKNANGAAEVPVNKPLADSINKVINDMHRSAGYQSDLSNRYIFGIHKNYWIVAGVVTVGIIGYSIYKKKSKS